MSNFKFPKQETVLIHGGQEPDPTTGSRAVPIYQTTSYVFKDTEHAQNLFGLKEPGNIYSRIMNPTVDTFEKRIALLEDGSAAVATSSGMAAITFSILNVADAGDEIIADSNLYGGTYNLFIHTLPRYGIQVKLVDGTNPENFEKAITPKTKAIFAESITNPSLHVFDVEAVADIAHKHHVPLIIDNTFSPYMFQPLKWGADIVVHSATKWIGGHGTTIGGVVVDGGRFDWNDERFPGFTEPDESYHGLKYADLGPLAFATKLRVQLLRDIGAALSPHSAFLLLQGLETLHLRIERHNENAQKVAAFLQKHPSVDWVNYPGLEDHPSHELGKKYFTNGFGSVITFGIKGGREAGQKVIDQVKLWSHLANVGDAKSLIIHPASTTHQQLSDEDLKKSGVAKELIRLSVGIETVEDALADLDQAIAKATNDQPIIQQTDQDAVQWLLHSPFSREDGNIRKKVIAVIGLKEENDPLSEQIKGLQALGYQVAPISDTKEQLVGEQTYTTVADLPEVDAILVHDEKLSKPFIDQVANANGNIVWIEKSQTDHETLEHAKATGLTVVTDRSLYKEAKQARRNARFTEHVHV
ncbi:MAG TPA: aminotransferase class I/II-fold pyridoxal phosphate-dependent enzyme [Bacillota bacterium]